MTEHPSERKKVSWGELAKSWKKHFYAFSFKPYFFKRSDANAKKHFLKNPSSRKNF